MPRRTPGEIADMIRLLNAHYGTDNTYTRLVRWAYGVDDYEHTHPESKIYAPGTFVQPSNVISDAQLDRWADFSANYSYAKVVEYVPATSSIKLDRWGYKETEGYYLLESINEVNQGSFYDLDLQEFKLKFHQGGFLR